MSLRFWYVLSQLFNLTTVKNNPFQNILLQDLYSIALAIHKFSEKQVSLKVDENSFCCVTCYECRDFSSFYVFLRNYFSCIQIPRHMLKCPLFFCQYRICHRLQPKQIESVNISAAAKFIASVICILVPHKILTVTSIKCCYF